jgi:hypothetical protein
MRNRVIKIGYKCITVKLKSKNNSKDKHIKIENVAQNST